MPNYSLYLIATDRSHLDRINKSIAPEVVNFFDGTDYPSFSKLVNDCVEQAPTEIVIIMSDRVTPTADQVQKTVELIEQGYAMVGLYRFAFFGFKKELFRQIGPLDEYFAGGGCEDYDYCLRIQQAGLASYFTHDVEYQPGKSRWVYGHYNKKATGMTAVERLQKKWSIRPKLHAPTKITQLGNKVELSKHYDWGANIPTTFLPYSYTHIDAPKTFMVGLFPKKVEQFIMPFTPIIPQGGEESNNV